MIKVIKNLDTKKSAGHDNISILIIKKLADELSIPLTCIFNMSLKSGVVPDQLKIARVVPISLIIDQFQFCQVFQKFLKGWSLIDVYHF